MPRVHTQTKSRTGRERHCGTCRRKIEPGERYFSFSFRYGGTHYRCADHYPRPSELTQSKMSEILSAIESAEDQIDGCETIEDVKDLIEEVASTAEQVASEYREAAEAFGGQGENAERADELDSWVSGLQSFDPEEPYDPADEVEAEVVEDDPEPESEPEGLPEETILYYSVEGTGHSQSVEREVSRHDFDPMGDGEIWSVVVYDAWYVDAEGVIEADGGIQRRINLRTPPNSGSGGADLIAGDVVKPDYDARFARTAGPKEPPKPRERLTLEDALAAAKEQAQELLGEVPG